MFHLIDYDSFISFPIMLLFFFFVFVIFVFFFFFFFFSSRRRHTRWNCDWSSDVCSSDLDAGFGLISDIDDTILETGVQRLRQLLKQTFTGSALTRTPFPGAAPLYRDLAAGVNPVFYVSSSPWNLHTFLVAFLQHRDFPLGPVLLRDLLGTSAGREPKHVRIREILELHPTLRFVLVGDSGEE